MSGQVLKRIAVALGVLLVLWGLSTVFAHRSDSVRGSLRLPTISDSTRDTILIAHGRDTTLLVQVSPSVWTANGHPAAPGSENDLVRAMRDSSPRDIASMSRGSFGLMGVDTNAWTLRVGSAAHSRFTLVVGNQGPDYNTGYVRLAQSDTVYLWRGSLPELVRRAPDSWRDHVIAMVPAESIQTIAVGRGAKVYTLRRVSRGWTVGAAPADSTKVANLLAQLRTLRAQGFGTPAALDSLARQKKRSRRSIVIRGKGPKPLLALTLDSAATGFWTTKAGDPTIFRLDNWQASQITPVGDSLTRH